MNDKAILLTDEEKQLAWKLEDAGLERHEGEEWVSQIVQAAFERGAESVRS